MYPHLTDTESVRAEASQQYGGLSDAAALIQAHQAAIDPNIVAVSNKRVNIEETKKVLDDLSIAQKKIDTEYGKDKFEVIDAAVRGEALSVVATDKTGRPVKLVVGYTDRYKPVVRTEDEEAAAAGAQAETKKGLLGAEARAEITRQVEEATKKIMADVGAKFGKKIAAVTPETDETAAAADEGSESKAGGEGKWPRQHDALDELANKSNVDLPEDWDDLKVDEKIDVLQKAGVSPPES